MQLFRLMTNKEKLKFAKDNPEYLLVFCPGFNGKKANLCTEEEIIDSFMYSERPKELFEGNEMRFFITPKKKN